MPSAEPPVAAVPLLHASRHLFVDRRGAGMRVTTHTARGLVVLSLWRGERCTGTFQLDPGDAARLVAALSQGLAALAGAQPASRDHAAGSA